MTKIENLSNSIATLADGDIFVAVDVDASNEGKQVLASTIQTYVMNGPTLGAAMDGGGNDLNNLGVLFLTEQAAAEADVAGKGQIWVKTATPNQLWFTDDAGTDVQLGTGGLTVGTTAISSGTAGRVLFEDASNVLNESTELRVNSDGYLGAGGDADAAGTTNSKVHIQHATAGQTVRLKINHTNVNTGTSDAGISIFSGGASGGDAWVNLGVDGVAEWFIGLDNSASDAFVISASSNLSNPEFKISGTAVTVARSGGSVGLYGATPVARATTGIAEAAFTENAGGTAVNVDSTFGGYTLQQIAQALQDIGVLT